jgi:CBS domain-containing protein
MQPTVAELMAPCPAVIQASSSISEAALRMLHEHTREMVVTDEDGHFLGVVRADDLFAVYGPTIRPAIRRARAAVSKDTTPLEAMRAMYRIGDRKALVVDGNKVIGIFMWQESMAHSVI